MILGGCIEHDNGCGRKKTQPLFLSFHNINISKQFLGPGGSSAECMQVSVMKI